MRQDPSSRLRGLLIGVIGKTPNSGDAGSRLAEAIRQDYGEVAA